MKIFEIIFSPTGGTEKVADILAEAWAEKTEKVDLSDYNVDFGEISVSEDDICIIAVPSFGGRVPEVAVERLEKIKGNNSKAVLVAVYGNREFEDTLIELEDTVVKAGFKVVAGISAIAEHSIARQFATNRPDNDDAKDLKVFVEQIKEKLNENTDNKPHFTGNRPYKEFKKSCMPQIVDESCVNCGICAKKCPVGAISENNPAHINEEKCFSCMRCISVCPKNARKLNPAVLEGVGQRLAPVCSERKENKLYL